LKDGTYPIALGVDFWKRIAAQTKNV
jgi:hypothetical protein